MAKIADQISYIEIDGIQLIEEIGRGAQGIVYRAYRNEQMVAVKISNEKSDRFKKEAIVLGRINHESLPQIIDVGETAHFNYFVMEFIAGKTLAERIKENLLSENECVRLAKVLVAGLIEINRRGLVHADIKPANILITEMDLKPKLIDFGFAHANKKSVVSDQIIGTFLYSAPEQTGMLKRELDGRTDLYALGITLFESLTGQLPYTSTDAAELIRAHAFSPIPKVNEINPEISFLLSEVIAKLMAKDPDDRYQTAISLLSDLEALQELTPELLGRTHSDIHFSTEAPMIGRAAEMGTMLQSFNKSKVQKEMQLISIEGGAGSGKSRLLRQLVNQIDPKTTLLLRAKCNFSENAPLALIRRLIENYILEVEDQNEELKKQGLKNLVDAAGEYASVLKEFSPLLNSLFSDVAPFSDNNLTQEQFFAALSQMMIRLMKNFNHSLLSLDDIQWIDSQSLAVLHLIISNFKNASALVICTSRDDEKSAQATNLFKALLQQSQLQVLPLQLLDETSTAQLVSYHLGDRLFDAELSKKIYELSLGSPFAINEYIHTIFEAGCLLPSDLSWSVDFKKIENLNLPKDVFALVGQRILSLPSSVKQVLSVASLCGTNINLNLLKSVCQLTEDSVESLMAEALQSYLIERGPWGGYRFIHDRIREVFLSFTGDPIKRRQQFTQIAIHFEQITSTKRSHADIYDLARYYAGSNYFEVLEKAFSANFKAGEVALKDFANLSALEFLKFALDLSADIQNLNHEQLRTLHETLAETHLRLAQLQEAFEHFSKALMYCESRWLRAKIRCRMSMVQLTTQKVIPANDELKMAFLECEVQLPESIWSKLLGGLGYAFLAGFMYQSRLGFGTAKNKNYDRHRVLAELTSFSTQIFYYKNDIPGIFYAAFKSLYHVHRLGISYELCTSYIFMGCLAGVLKLRTLLNFFCNGAVSAAQALSNPLLLAQSHMMKAISVNFSGKVREAEMLSQNALVEFESWLPALEWLIGAGDYITTLLLRGYTTDVIGWGEKAFHRIAQSGPQIELVQTHGAYPIIAAAYALKGDFQKAAMMLNDFRKRIEKTPDEPYLWNAYLSCQMIVLVEQNDLGSNLEEIINKNKSFHLNPLTCLFHFRQVFINQAYARLAQYEYSREEEKLKAFRNLKIAYRELYFAANVPLYSGHCCIIKAAIYRIEKKYKKAEKALAQAEKIAALTDSPLMIYEIALQKAIIFKETNCLPQSQLQIDLACHLAEDQGWSRRAEKLSRQRSYQKREVTISKPLQTNLTQNLNSLTYQKHRDSLMQLGFALSKTINPDEQIKIALSEIVKLLNAERAFLFLFNDKQQLNLKLGLNSVGDVLDQLEGFSRTVIERVRSNPQSIVLTGTHEREVISSESIIANNLRSILAAPLMMRDEVIGVVYLDSRIAKGIFSNQDVDILTVLANHIAVALETGKTAHVLMAQQTLELDLQLAATVQSLLLPEKDLFETDFVRGVAFYKSASQTGGDWWYQHHKNNTQHIVLADVTGHGAGSGMVSAAAIGVYQTLIRSEIDLPTPQILTTMNENFNQLVREQYSMTLFALSISDSGRKLDAWSAGAPEVYIFKKNDEVITLLDVSTPFGYPELQLAPFSTALEPGDRIVIFTDGVLEFKPVQDQRWGPRQFINLLKNCKNKSLIETRNFIARTLQNLQGDNPPDDDMTFVIIEIK